MSESTQLALRSLDECEVVIERGRQAFVDVGNALAEIRDRLLYRETHATFEAYCKERWGLGKSYVYYQIAAAEVATELSTIVDVPTESVARELVALSHDERLGVAERVDLSIATAAEVRKVAHAVLAGSRPQEAAPLPVGKYRCIVIDPPWPIEKIARDERPNQTIVDYPTMALDDIRALPIEELVVEGGCHVYLWTTHKFLPAALDIFEGWGVKYQCLMTWVKNVGFTPFSWMYSTEHVLFGRVGSLDVERKGLRLDFAAKVREHSRKPDEFYELVRLASPGPRLEMFARETREGFTAWGNETGRF
jgi:N6-adenosine-specific RNA methylase IME4